jgi:hypothetical protein
MALSAATRYSTRGGTNQTNSYKVANAEVIYFHAFVGIETVGLGTDMGYLVAWNDSSGQVIWKGLAIPPGDSVTGSTSASPVVECGVDESGAELLQVTVTGAASIANVGDTVFASDDATLTLTTTSNVGPVGYVTRYHSSTTCDVKLYTPQEHRALETIDNVN